MSTFSIEAVRLDDVKTHTGADLLELAVIGGYQAVVQKGLHKAGDLVLYVPEDSVIPPDVIDLWGFTDKLAGSKKNRVKAVKLRGELSQGLVISQRMAESALTMKQTQYIATLDALNGQEKEPEPGQLLNLYDNGPLTLGRDYSVQLGITKYEEPIPVEMAGRARPRPSWFPTYTDIENIKKYNRTFSVGEEVIVTEKLHGTNFGAAMHREQYVLYVSSRRMVLEQEDGNLYWRAAKQASLEAILRSILNITSAGTVAIWGEIYGKGVQDLDYGIAQGQIGYKWFDLILDSTYQSYDTATELVRRAAMIAPAPYPEHVPVLYRGPYDPQTIQIHTDGPSVMSGHIREGVVVRPVVERQGGRTLSRVILKSISEAYLLRKGGTERH